MNSHGFLTKSVEKKEIALIRQKVSIFLKSESQKSNYYKNISEKIDNLNDLINPVLFDKVNNLLANSNPELSQIELHVQEAGCPGIPPHQDNFYHCIDPDKGLKVLIPLQNLSPTNGGLIYLDIDKTYPVVNHSPSNILNFSAYIDNQIFSKLEKKHTSYELKVGDIVFHFINSIHYSLGNKTKKDSLFLVYRYQWPKALIDKKAEEKYNKCYSLHVKKLNKIIK